MHRSSLQSKSSKLTRPAAQKPTICSTQLKITKKALKPSLRQFSTHHDDEASSLPSQGSAKPQQNQQHQQNQLKSQILKETISSVELPLLAPSHSSTSFEPSSSLSSPQDHQEVSLVRPIDLSHFSPSQYIHFPPIGTPKYSNANETIPTSTLQPTHPIALKPVLFSFGVGKPTPHRQLRYLSPEEQQAYLDALMPPELIIELQNLEGIKNQSIELPPKQFHRYKYLSKRNDQHRDALAASNFVDRLDQELPKEDRLTLLSYLSTIQRYQSLGPKELVKFNSVALGLDQSDTQYNDYQDLFKNPHINKTDIVRGTYIYDLTRLSYHEYHNFVKLMDRLGVNISSLESRFCYSAVTTIPESLQFKKLLPLQRANKINANQASEFVYLSGLDNIARVPIQRLHWRQTFESVDQWTDLTNLYRHFKRYTLALYVGNVIPFKIPATSLPPSAQFLTQSQSESGTSVALPPPFSQYSLEMLTAMNEIVLNNGSFGKSWLALIYKASLLKNLKAEILQGKHGDPKSPENQQTLAQTDPTHVHIEPIDIFYPKNSPTHLNSRYLPINAIGGPNLQVCEFIFPARYPQFPINQESVRKLLLLRPTGYIQLVLPRYRQESDLDSKPTDSILHDQQDFRPDGSANTRKFHDQDIKFKADLWASDLSQDEKDALYAVMSPEELDEFSRIRHVPSLRTGDQKRFLELSQKLFIFRGAKQFKRSLRDFFKLHTPNFIHQLYPGVLKKFFFPPPLAHSYSTSSTSASTSASINSSNQTTQIMDSNILEGKEFPDFSENPTYFTTDDPTQQSQLYQTPTEPRNMSQRLQNIPKDRRKLYPFPTNFLQLYPSTANLLCGQSESNQDPLDSSQTLSTLQDTISMDDLHLVLSAGKPIREYLKLLDVSTYLSPNQLEEYNSYVSYLDLHKKWLSRKGQVGTESTIDNQVPEGTESAIDNNVSTSSTHTEQSGSLDDIEVEVEEPIPPTLSEPFDSLEFKHSTYQRYLAVQQYLTNRVDAQDSETYHHLSSLGNQQLLFDDIQTTFNQQQASLRDLFDAAIHTLSTKNSNYSSMQSKVHTALHARKDVKALFQELEAVCPVQDRITYLTYKLSPSHNIDVNNLLQGPNLQTNNNHQATLFYPEEQYQFAYSSLKQKFDNYTKSIEIIQAYFESVGAFTTHEKMQLSELIDLFINLSPKLSPHFTETTQQAQVQVDATTTTTTTTTTTSLSTKSKKTKPNSKLTQIPTLAATTQPEPDSRIDFAKHLPNRFFATLSSLYPRSHQYLLAHNKFESLRLISLENMTKLNDFATRKRATPSPDVQPLSKEELRQYNSLLSFVQAFKPFRNLFNQLDNLSNIDLNNALETYTPISETILLHNNSSDSLESNPLDWDDLLTPLVYLPEQLRENQKKLLSNDHTNSYLISQQLVKQLPNFISPKKKLASHRHFLSKVSHFFELQSAHYEQIERSSLMYSLQHTIQGPTLKSSKLHSKKNLSLSTELQVINASYLSPENHQVLDEIISLPQRTELYQLLQEYTMIKNSPTSSAEKTAHAAVGSSIIHLELKQKRDTITHYTSLFKQYCARRSQVLHHNMIYSILAPNDIEKMLAKLSSFDLFLTNLGQSLIHRNASPIIDKDGNTIHPSKISSQMFSKTAQFIWQEDEIEYINSMKKPWNQFVQVTSTQGFAVKNLDQGLSSGSSLSGDINRSQSGSAAETVPSVIENQKLSYYKLRSLFLGAESFSPTELFEFQILQTHHHQTMTQTKVFFDSLRTNAVDTKVQDNQQQDDTSTNHSSQAILSHLRSIIQVDSLLTKHQIRLKGFQPLPSDLDVIHHKQKLLAEESFDQNSIQQVLDLASQAAKLIPRRLEPVLEPIFVSDHPEESTAGIQLLPAEIISPSTTNTTSMIISSTQPPGSTTISKASTPKPKSQAKKTESQTEPQTESQTESQTPKTAAPIAKKKPTKSLDNLSSKSSEISRTTIQSPQIEINQTISPLKSINTKRSTKSPEIEMNETISPHKSTKKSTKSSKIEEVTSFPLKSTKSAVILAKESPEIVIKSTTSSLKAIKKSTKSPKILPVEEISTTKKSTKSSKNPIAEAISPPKAIKKSSKSSKNPIAESIAPSKAIKKSTKSSEMVVNETISTPPPPRSTRSKK